MSRGNYNRFRAAMQREYLCFATSLPSRTIETLSDGFDGGSTYPKTGGRWANPARCSGRAYAQTDWPTVIVNCRI